MIGMDKIIRKKTRSHYGRAFMTHNFMLLWFLNIFFAVFAFTHISICGTHTKKGNKSNKVTVNFADRRVQGFNMRVWLSNQMTMGLEAWDVYAGGQLPEDPRFGMEYPAGSGVEHIYGAGPRLGGKVDGVIHVDEGYNGNDARKEFLPEYRHLPREHFWQTSIRDTIGKPNKRNCDDDQDGKIDEDELDGTDNDGDWNPAADDVGGDGLADPYEVSCDGKAYDPVTNPDPAADDYDPGVRDKCRLQSDGSRRFKNNRDLYTEKNGMPDHGEPHVDEDYAAVSENDLYCWATDTFSTPVVAGHFPMGIKCIQKSYAWDGKYFEGVLPFDYWFVNLGRKTVTDVYVGFFADMDVGPVNITEYYAHNYSAYIDSLRTAYIHNAIDRGSTPIGITVLAAPKPLDQLKFIFQWSNWTTRNDPGTDDSTIYTWMDGSAFPGEPIAPNQDPTLPTETRFFFSFGPFEEFKPGDTLKISVALVSGYGVFEGSNNLKENAQKAIKLYSRGYVAPTIPASPKLDIDIGFKRVSLKWHPHESATGGMSSPFDIWDDSSRLAGAYPDDHWRRRNPPCGGSIGQCGGHKCDSIGRLPGGRIFSGFRLYRSEDVSGDPQLNSFVLLKEYSIPDTATEWSLNNLDSVFVDSNLVRGKRYWYAVTSFGLPDITVLQIPRPDGTLMFDTLYSENSESNLRENWVKVDLPFSASQELGQVLVVPNPYRVDEEYTYENGGWEGLARYWDENKRMIKFIHLPKGEWTMRIFTLAGDLITTVSNTRASGYIQGNKWMEDYEEERGEINWNLLSESNRALASGVYIFSVESDLSRQIGKFVLIR
jgi:hypothetical protein